MNIVVLAGGISSERDVSLSSGSLVCRALREKGHNAVMIDAFMGLEGYSGTIEELFKNCSDEHIVKVDTLVPDIDAVRRARKLKSGAFFGERVLEACTYADVVFIALHGGEGEDGRVQAALSLLDIKYTGTDYLGSALAMDKDLAKMVFIAAGITTPKSITVDAKAENAGLIMEKIGVPCVVKPVNGGSSIGVTIVKDAAELTSALENCGKYDPRALVEEFISGREFSVGVLNGKALPPIEIIPTGGFYNYECKYQSGATREVCPADITPEQEKKLMDAALMAHESLRLGAYSRSEFILTAENRVYCLEANTLPGMTPTSLLPQEAAVVGYTYEDLCEEIVRTAFEK